MSNSETDQGGTDRKETDLSEADLHVGRANAAIRVDIVSDVVCPWCIVGYKQLEQAAEKAHAELDVHWHPFELNPDMPPEGENLREHIARKYGATPADGDRNRARLTELGEALGFPFRYGEASRIVNTFKAHQLLHWAETLGRGAALKMSLFDAYFTRQEDINDEAVLVAAAERTGLDGGEAKAVLADNRFAAIVRQRERFWTERGVQGVPAMIFEEKFITSGAQGVENFTAILEEVRSRKAA